MSDDLSIPNPGYRNGNRAGRYNRAAQQQQRRPGMDPDTRRLVLFAGGVGGVLALLIAASAITSRHAGQVPVVTASSEPIRVKPDNPGGLHVATAENDVFSGGTDTKNVRLAPAAEKPDPQALQADDEAPAQSAPAQPALAQAAPAAPSAPEAPALAKPAGTATKDAAAPPAKSAVQAAPAKSAAQAEAPAAKAAATAAKPQEAAAPARQPEARPGAHSVMVQLAAMTTETGAKEEWQRLNKRYADVLEGRSLIVSKTERDGHTFWRVRTGGFSDVAQARAFCERLRGKSSGCSIVEF